MLFNGVGMLQGEESITVSSLLVSEGKKVVCDPSYLANKSFGRMWSSLGRYRLLPTAAITSLIFTRRQVIQCSFICLHALAHNIEKTSDRLYACSSKFLECDHT